MAQVDMFLKLDGIDGESKDSSHGGEIDIESLSWSLSQEGTFGTSTGGGAGKVAVGNIQISKQVDKATCALLLQCCNGKPVSSGKLTIRKAGANPLEYLVIELQDILISAVGVSGSTGILLAENLALNFGKFKVKYQLQKPDGTGEPAGEMGWDIPGNTQQ